MRNVLINLRWSLGVLLGLLVVPLGVLAFVALPAVSGMIARGEMDFWVWDHFDRVGWHGWAGAMDAFAYAVFYLSLIALPRYLLYLTYSESVPENERREREIECWVVSLWVTTTFVLFHRAIFAFFLALPHALSALPTWIQLFTLLWVVLTVVAISTWRSLGRMKRRATNVGMPGG